MTGIFLLHPNVFISLKITNIYLWKLVKKLKQVSSSHRKKLPENVHRFHTIFLLFGIKTTLLQPIQRYG